MKGKTYMPSAIPSDHGETIKNKIIYIALDDKYYNTYQMWIMLKVKFHDTSVYKYTIDFLRKQTNVKGKTICQGLNNIPSEFAKSVKCYVPIRNKLKCSSPSWRSTLHATVGSFQL